MKKTGFSLIEIMVAMGIFAVIMAIATNIIATSVRNSAKSEGLNQVRQDVDNMISIVERNLKNSRSIYLCNPDYGGGYVVYLDEANDPRSFICEYNSPNGYLLTWDSTLLNSDSTVLQACQITCEPPDPNDTKTVTLELTAQSRNESGSSQANYSIRHDILLRNTSD